MAAPAAWTIDRLAAHAGMTVRNVRAHAARGLLPPPLMQGRTGFYGDEHLARLELITRLQGEGFSLGAIERLMLATPNQSAERAISQYLEMLAPWQAEPPVELEREELATWLGIDDSPDIRGALLGAGLLEHLDDRRVRVHSPAMVRVGAEAVRLGLPIGELLATRARVLEHVTSVTAEFTDLFRRTVWRSFLDAGLPVDGLDDVRLAVATLQPIAAQTVMSAFRTAMPAAVAEMVRAASRDLGDEEDAPHLGRG